MEKINTMTVEQLMMTCDTHKYNLNKPYFKKQGRKTIEYMADFGTYDSEVSTIITKREWNARTKREDIEASGLLYIWQVCLFGEYYVVGRTLKEFKQLMDYLNDAFYLTNKRRLVLYVHNLEYDAQFLLSYIDKPTIFATDKRAILYLRDRGVEFRCSYRLTNMTLDKFTKSMNVAHAKQSGEDFDYSIIRTPDTELTEEEMYYCYCDVKGLHEAITARMELDHDNIATIPFTSTGYVRREARKAVQENPYNRTVFEKCEMDEHIYTLLKQAFRGGNTHANRNHAFDIQTNICSYDLASSYPSVMMYCDSFVTDQYRPIPVKTTENMLALYKGGYSILANITMKNVRTKVAIPYIPVDKCLNKMDWQRAIADNGRILFAPEVTMTVLGQDLEIILNQYDMDDELIINECYYAPTDKLPKELREVIADFFIKKTELKGVEGQEYYYAKSKNLLNSLFGMMVQDPVTTPITWKEGEWKEGKKNATESLEHFNKSYNSFLVYAWGCIITAEARKRLQSGLDIVGDKIVYTDTDSLKFFYDKKLCKLLDAENKKIESLANASDVPCIAYTKKGVKQVMGMWDNEGIYDKFRTYGAKKYAVEKDGEFEVTVAGLNKKKGSREFECIENFILGVTVEDSGRTRAIYDDNIEDHPLIVNGKVYNIRSNIAIVETTYTLGVTEEYEQLHENEYEY